MRQFWVSGCLVVAFFSAGDVEAQSTLIVTERTAGIEPACEKVIVAYNKVARLSRTPGVTSVTAPVGHDAIIGCLHEIKSDYPLAWRSLEQIVGGSLKSFVEKSDASKSLKEFMAEFGDFGVNREAHPNLPTPEQVYGAFWNTYPHKRAILNRIDEDHLGTANTPAKVDLAELAEKLDACSEFLTSQDSIDRNGGGVSAVEILCEWEIREELAVDPSQHAGATLKTFLENTPATFDADSPTLAVLLQSPKYRASHWLHAFTSVGIVAILLGWWATITMVRMIWCVTSRRLGLYNPAHFRFWTYLWPWRTLYRPLLPVFAWVREFSHGKRATAKWTPILETMTLLYKPGLIPLGRLRWLGLPWFQPIGIAGSGRHLAMIAAPGSGKTAMLITMLGLHKGTCFVVDCDAQMINVVGNRLGRGGRGVFGKGNDVRLLDPYRQAKAFPGSTWNAIGEMHRFVKEHGRDAAVGFAQTMAEALIKASEGQNAWVQQDARAFLKGLILYVGFHEQPSNQHLVRFRRLLANGLETEYEDEDGFKKLLTRMKGIDDFNGAIANAAGIMESNHGSDGKNHPRADAVAQTQWLDLPQLAAICKGKGSESRSDFDLHDFKKGRLCLFICAPVTDVQTKLSGYFRLLTMLTMEVFQRLETVSLRNPCLFALDEMPALGHIEVIQTAAPVFRKYGVRLLCIAQDIERLKAVYPHSWEGFLGTAEAIMWMGLEHDATLEYLSKKLSTSTRDEKAEGGGFFSKVAPRSQKVERPLLYPPQIKELLDPQRGNVIVTRFGKRPLRLKSIPYFTELPVCFYDADLKFSERFGRRLGRRICALVAPSRGAAPEPRAQSLPVEEHPALETMGKRPRSTAADVQEIPHRSEPFMATREQERRDEPREQSNVKPRKETSKPKAADINFLRAFTECFDERDGTYPHPRIRRKVWEGFAPYIMQGGEFAMLKLQLEDWLAAEIEERPRAEHVMIFFEDWIEHSRRRDRDAAAEG